jgi:hypothetical protein
MNDKTRDLICGTIFLALGIFMYRQSKLISPIIPKEVGSGFFPLIVAVVFMSLAALLIVFSLLKKGEATSRSSEDIGGGTMTILAIITYVALFKVLGFLIATTLYLFVQIMILSNAKNRNLPLFGAISIVTPVIIYFLFVKAFNLILPPGILPF